MNAKKTHIELSETRNLRRDAGKANGRTPSESNSVREKGGAATELTRQVRTGGIEKHGLP